MKNIETGGKNNYLSCIKLWPLWDSNILKVKHRITPPAYNNSIFWLFKKRIIINLIRWISNRGLLNNTIKTDNLLRSFHKEILSRRVDSASIKRKQMLEMLLTISSKSTCFRPITFSIKIDLKLKNYNNTETINGHSFFCGCSWLSVTT